MGENRGIPLPSLPSVPSNSFLEGGDFTVKPFTSFRLNRSRALMLALVLTLRTSDSRTQTVAEDFYLVCETKAQCELPFNCALEILVLTY